jgi:hypothetical protein
VFNLIKVKPKKRPPCSPSRAYLTNIGKSVYHEKNGEEKKLENFNSQIDTKKKTTFAPK